MESCVIWHCGFKFQLNQMWRHILAYLWAYLIKTQDVCFLDLWYFRWRGTSLSARNCLLSLRMFPLYSGEPPGGHLQSSHTNQLLSLSKQSNNYKIAFGFYAVLWCFFKKVGIEALLDDNYNFYDNIGRVHSWILTFVIFRCASILIHPHVSILLQPYGQ